VSTLSTGVAGWFVIGFASVVGGVPMLRIFGMALPSALGPDVQD